MNGLEGGWIDLSVCPILMSHQKLYGSPVHGLHHQINLILRPLRPEGLEKRVNRGFSFLKKIPHLLTLFYTLHKWAIPGAGMFTRIDLLVIVIVVDFVSAIVLIN